MNQDIDKIIRKVSSTMSLEGMPLTAADKDTLRKCIIGESTIEIEKQKIVKQLRVLNNGFLI